MQDGLIKRYAKFDNPLEEDLISVNIFLEIDTGNDNPILENIKMNFNKNSNVNDMIKEIIPNFNDSLANKNKKIYLNPESNEYQLCECIENIDGGIRTYINGNILEKRTKLQNTSSRNFKILYSAKDVLLNFQRKKTICDACIII